MRAEPRVYRWAVLLLVGVAVLTSGCVTLVSPQVGSGAQGPRAMSALRATAAGSAQLETPSAFASTEPGEQERSASSAPEEEERLHRRRGARGLGPEVAKGSADEASPSEVARGGTAPQGSPTCGGQAVPEGWPDYSTWWDGELLEPFLMCTSPAEFLTLQDRVDMPRLVEALSDWNAVLLGALGPVREDTASLLNRKRTAFLLRATEEYGPPRAEVFALFILHSAHDDDLREILFLLAQDKQLEEMLRLLPTFRVALEDRGLKPSARADREFEWKDMGRGLARAGRDALATSPMVGGGRENALFSIRSQLPPPYQQALNEVETALAREHFAPGNVALGTFDHLTFGVPLGFYGLLAGTGHGAYSLYQGQYEQATRELAPAVLLAALYAGGKGLRALSEGRGVPGVGVPRLRGLMGVEVRLQALKAVVRELELLLGGGWAEAARQLHSGQPGGGPLRGRGGSGRGPCPVRGPGKRGQGEAVAVPGQARQSACPYCERWDGEELQQGGRRGGRSHTSCLQQGPPGRCRQGFRGHGLPGG
ncbi:hypothetical protein NVS55_08060 [Myxococcus stipitatus]|uniref:hypothetical protein n=1 Tax=Myxococcus stipitatus TaxID=83455 RepID=UPI003144E909